MVEIKNNSQKDIEALSVNDKVKFSTELNLLIDSMENAQPYFQDYFVANDLLEATGFDPSYYSKPALEEVRDSIF